MPIVAARKDSHEIMSKLFPQSLDAKERRTNRLYIPGGLAATALSLLTVVAYNNATEIPDHPKPLAFQTELSTEVDPCIKASESLGQDAIDPASCIEAASDAIRLNDDGVMRQWVEVTEDGKIRTIPLG